MSVIWALFICRKESSTYRGKNSLLTRCFRKTFSLFIAATSAFCIPALEKFVVCKCRFHQNDIWSVFYECYMGVWWVLYRAVLRYMSVIWTAIFWNWCFMSVTWVLYERYMGAFYLRKRVLYLSRKKQPFYTLFQKNFFLVYCGAPVEEIKTTALTVC